jgi:hypothetical protein
MKVETVRGMRRGASRISRLGKIGDDAHHDQEKQVRNTIATTRK